MQTNICYKFRIYPNKQQEQMLWKTFGCCRFVWNTALNRQQENYKAGSNFISLTDLEHMVMFMKTQPSTAFLKEVDSMALQSSLRDLDVSYQRLFKKLASKPKFKNRKNKQSYRTNCVNNNIHFCDFQNIKENGSKKNSYLALPKLGWMLIKKHREVDGEIINCTISASKSGKYFVSICVKQEMSYQKHKKGKIGIDLGLKCFCMTSNENQIGNNHFLIKAQKQLNHQQRKLSRKQHDSNNYLKQCKIIGKCYDKVCNCRNDFQWKLANDFAKNNSVICIENLNVKNMIKNHCLAQRISDVAWNSFVNKLIWECKKYKTKLYEVNTFYPSSQTCNKCGYVNKKVKDLKVRQWICPKCGAVLERDFNAAKNILKEGLKTKNDLVKDKPKKKLSILKKKKTKKEYFF